MENLAGMFATIEKTKTEFPENLMAKFFDKSYFDALTTVQQQRFCEIISSGVANPDSQIGCYAMHVEDYKTFFPFLSQVVYSYHHVLSGSKHKSNWDLESLGANTPQTFDLSVVGMKDVSMRVRVARNFRKFPLPCHMTKEDRLQLETDMVEVFKNLMKLPEFGGRYYSLTPGHEFFMDDVMYKELVDTHIMYKDCTTDPHMASVGLTNDWPFGRGCYVSESKDFIIWVGEEDHLRVMSMKRGVILSEPFNRLKFGLDYIEKEGHCDFCVSETFGTVTSCPSNLGTGMRASVHMYLPNLATKPLDVIKATAKPFGLSVRGKYGENTPLGEGGLCDISVKARFYVSEAEILSSLYRGIAALAEKDKEVSFSSL